MKKELPSQVYLNSILEYRDGLLYWKAKTSKMSRINIGNLAGTLNSSGYYIIYINLKEYKQHNIIWKMFTGNDPKEQIDHINHNRSDNRIENLRDVSHKENSKNRTKNKNSTTGYSNIYINRHKKYQVQFNGINKYSKSFSSLEEAIQHRNEKYIEFGYHSNHGLVVDESNIL